MKSAKRSPDADLINSIFNEQRHFKTVIVHGARACGKTHNAKAIARHFGIPETNIVDDWDADLKALDHRRLTPGFLYLTSTDPQSCRRRCHIPDIVEVVKFADLPPDFATDAAAPQNGGEA